MSSSFFLSPTYATMSNNPSGSSSSSPTVTTTNTVTPKMIITNPKVRKVQCRGLTSKNKNLTENTLVVLKAMQQKPPFVPHGQRRLAWEAVADIARSVPDLLHVNGALCEARYKQVRGEYLAAQASSRRATGISEAAPTEQDELVENLVTLERDALQREENEKQDAAAAAAEENRQQALAKDIRDMAAAQLPIPSQSTPSNAEEIHDTGSSGGFQQKMKRRKRNAESVGASNEHFERVSKLLYRALEKYLDE